MTDLSAQPILILGMHRSGTSYLAALMQSLGVHIGDDLVGPQKGNPRGHFEARPLLEFHQRLIAARDASARRAFDEGMLVQQPLPQELSADEAAEARELVAALRRPGPWGWKEPRTCLFTRMWRGLLPQARPLVVYRHPLEVHQSLLRRGHWDLALFPDQAMRAYTVYNRELLAHAADGYTFNANAGFADLPRLTAGLCAAYGLRPAAGAPEFHAAEFQGLAVSEPLHRLFTLFFPEAAACFDELQRRAAIPYTWRARPDDAQLALAAERLAPVLEGAPAGARAAFVPLLDWWSGGRDEALLAAHESLGREIGEHIRTVKKWNEEAAVIFLDNKRLSEENERMGAEFARQQEFLKKQADTQAKVWDQLKRTGDSWKEQKKMLEELLAEKRSLLEEIQELRGRLGARDRKQP